MAIERRPRLQDGSFGALEKVGKGLTDKERVEILEEENAMIAYASMQKDARIDDLELSQSELIYTLMSGGVL